MALVKARTRPKMDEGIADKIKQRRLQVLVHSAIYYDFDTTIVPDAKWQQWADELVQLQNKYPEVAETVKFHEDFKDFDGTTGYHLPYRLYGIPNKAVQLLRYKKEMNNNEK